MRFLAHRTSSPIKDVAPPSNMGVQVLIPAALNRPTHTLYSICTAVQPTLQEWSVNRRYSQFLTLRGDLISTLTACRTGCPGCASFALSLKKFAFPRKTWIRTNRIVRKRVKSLQLFLQLIVERVYNDLPKCGVCGDGVKKMVRPFLMRGAQPIGDSTLDKIHHSLSLASYAIVKHKPRKAKHDTVKTKTVETHTQDDEASYTSTDRTDSDPALAEPESPTDIEFVDFASSTLSEDSYGKQYDDAQCTDDAVPLEEAMKQVVLLDKRKSTVEEVALRLSSMWSAYDFDDVLAAAPELEIKLSLTQEDGEEYYGDDTADETSSTIDILGNDMDDIEDEDDVHTDDENNTSLALLQDENNVSMTLLQDSIFDEDDDEDRLARKVDEITL